MFTRTRRTAAAMTGAAAVVSGLAGVCAAPTAASAHEATATAALRTATASATAAARPAPQRMPYRVTLAAPARLPGGVPTRTLSTTAVGISDTGIVAGNATAPEGSRGVFVNTGVARWLPSEMTTSWGDTVHASVGAVSPRGVLAGQAWGSADHVVRWSGRGDLQQVAGAAGLTTHRVTGVSDRGVIVGCGADSPGKVGGIEYWAPGKPARALSLRPYRPGLCEGAHVARDGSGVATLTNPMFRNDGVYPNALRFTARGAVRMPMPSASTVSTADAISPNGRWIVGRIGRVGAEPNRPVFLHDRAMPTPMRGAGVFVPAAVNDAGVVAGSRYGTAAVWANGRVTDLTSQSFGLPRGWVLKEAVGVNARGDIAANAYDPVAGVTVAVKLTRR